jgi:1-acyl-sn-glycerol-3-phosphate acyltransferase
LFRFFWKYWLRRNGWTLVGTIPADVPKMIIIAGPHTASADFFLGLAVRSVLRLDYIKFLGKAELFRPPFGFIFRWLGGTPVDRSGSKNMVQQVVDKFNQSERLVIAMSPEGTRKKVDRLRTGFYHIALGAKVPILLAGFDFANRKVIFDTPFYLSGNEQDDFLKILRFLGPIQGKVPELGLNQLWQEYEQKAGSNPA